MGEKVLVTGGAGFMGSDLEVLSGSASTAKGPQPDLNVGVGLGTREQGCRLLASRDSAESGGSKLILRSSR